MKLQTYALHNFRNIAPLAKYGLAVEEAINVVGHVLPFKTNNYVIDELINWDDALNDPMFKLTFPQREMLSHNHYSLMWNCLMGTTNKEVIKEVANKIRSALNPHPAGQMSLNVPQFEGERLEGLQHKYQETVLFFPAQGQTCHAYCTFCFRWPQFVGMEEWKFATREAENLYAYVNQNRNITDLLITGGDPMVMKTHILRNYLQKFLDEPVPHLKNIRIGTKALAYWPYRFTHDNDADELMALLDELIAAGIHITIMAHFSHPVELSTDAVKAAIKRLRSTGAQIRTQSPVLKHINADPAIWREMWREQVQLGCIPYYMFIPRDTGAQSYFSLPLEEAWQLFRTAYSQVSGICRTVRGPSMSCTPGKVQVLGISEVAGEKVFVLRMLQGRDPDWVARPFFAKYNPNATWMDELEPAFGEEAFFFEPMVAV